MAQAGSVLVGALRREVHSDRLALDADRRCPGRCVRGTWPLDNREATICAKIQAMN